LAEPGKLSKLKHKEDEMLVKEAMNRNPLKIHDKATVKEAVERMALHQAVDLVVVAEGDLVVGMLGVEEMLRLLVPEFDELLEKGTAPERLRPQRRASDTLPHLKVTEVMRRIDRPLHPEQSLESALGILLQGGGKTYPVISEGKLAGSLSAADVARSMMWRDQVAPAQVRPQEDRRKRQ
jgi:CBS domain-containing protein